MSINIEGQGCSEEAVEVLVALVKAQAGEILRLRKIVRWLSAVALAGLITVGVMIW